MINGSITIAGDPLKSGWRDGAPSLLNMANQLAYANGFLYVADVGNGLRRIDTRACPGYQQPVLFEPMTFARVLSMQPQEENSGDWYGEPAPSSFSWDDIFRADSQVRYSLFLSKIRPIVTMTRFGDGVWAIDRSIFKQPQRVMPGIWFPCKSRDCKNTVASFAYPTDEISGWHELRIEVYTNNGITTPAEGAMNLSSIAGPPWPPKSSPTAATGRMGPWSRYYFTNDNVVAHISDTPTLIPPDASAPVIHSVGWPAHYACPEGYMWLGGGNITCLSCLPGTFSVRVKGMKGGPYQCSHCPLGTFSSAVGSTACSICPSGSFAQVYGSSACARCPSSGMWTPPGAQTSLACGACPPGSANCTACVPGQYQNQAGQAVCLQCGPGTFSDMRGAVSCQECPLYTFQPLRGKSVCEPCPTATLFTGATACATCPRNSVCNLAVDGVCGRGCGFNRYAAAGACVNCPPNTLNAFALCALDVSACWIPAPNLYYSNGKIVPCPPGYDVLPSKDGCRLCDPGTYANANSSGRCGAGTFSPTVGQTACTLCGDGKFSAGGANTACRECEPGAFSAGIGASECLRCNPGSFSTIAGALSCTPCAPGSWSSVAGRGTACDARCDSGTVSGSGATACVSCARGAFVNQNECIGCGLGYYYTQGVCAQCPLGLVNTNQPYASNSSACVTCGLWPGTAAGSDKRWYANRAGTACLKAPQGTIGSGFGTTPCPIGTSRTESQPACTPCPDGTWSSSVGQIHCAPCPIGTFYAAGMLGCTKCPPHTMAPNMGAVECQPCPPGYEASMDGTRCDACPVNHYHIMGLGCQKCQPPNSISHAGGCAPCPDWTTLDGEQCSVCPPGKYMQFIDGIYFCTACDLGKHNPLHGARGAEACISCDAVGYVPAADAASCIPCPPGFSAPLDACVPCHAGTASADGIACVPCAVGGFSATSAATACLQCPEGTYGGAVGLTSCAPCPAGTTAASAGSAACKPCPLNAFQNRTGATACNQRKQKCDVGEYISVSALPDRDDTCAFCLPCPVNSYTVDATNYDVTEYDAAKCPGNTVAPPYRCILNDWKAGEYLDVGRAAAQAGVTVRITAAKTCDAIDKRKPMKYVVGPMFACYVGCKYGLNATGVDRYTNLFTTSGVEKPRENIFLYRNAIAYASQLCLPCPRGACPLGLYRPMDPTDATCGVPEGCVGICDEPPLNAVTIGGSAVVGRGKCPWSCKVGYHLSRNGLMCIACDDASVCEGNSILLPLAMCTPETREVCRECPPVEGGTPVSWSEDVGCVYRCAWGYYHTQTGGCAACRPKACPVGAYVDTNRCFSNQWEPECVNCSLPGPRAAFTSAGDENTDNCKWACKPGFRDATCRPCTPSEPCQGRCPVGTFKTSESGCSPCTRTCDTGYYAPVCDGALADPGCLKCPADELPKNAMFVPSFEYTLDTTLLLYRPSCPIACKHNHVQWQGACISCPEFWNKTGCATCRYDIFSHWNASGGRSGKCLPCPVGFGVLPGDADLCMLLPGFGTGGGASKQAIPSLGNDISIAYREPRPVDWGGKGGRRLLQSISDTQIAQVRQCPVGFYNDRTEDACIECPPGSSTYTTTSTSVENCKCYPGYQPLAGPGCSACPRDMFRGKDDTNCRACPPGETTFGKTGSTACGCEAGKRRYDTVCIPCEPNTFCVPCFESQADCPVSGVNQFDCFPLGLSPPGSTSIKNCTCASGLTRLSRPMGDPGLASSYYCIRPPPNSVYDGTRIACRQGWTAVWERNQLAACTLCSPGFYYDDGKCLPCPVGTYTGVSDTIGACTPCPCGGGRKQGAISVEDGCSICLTEDMSNTVAACPRPNAVRVLGDCLCDKGYFYANATACAPCPVGTFSPHVSNTPACIKCPEGSTTADVAATHRTRCGETEDLCSYVFMGPGMCRPGRRF